jgi:hypothetical protein
VGLTADAPQPVGIFVGLPVLKFLDQN